MSTKIIYTSPEHFGSNDAIDVLSPKQLNKLLDEGYAVIKRKTVTIPHPTNKKAVRVEQLHLSTEAESRAVATTAPEAPASRGVKRYEDEEGGIGHAIIPSRPDNGSYLGSGGDFAELINATGPSVGRAISGEVAFGMGVDAAKLGKLANQCPMRPGTLPHREWMSGFAAGGGNMPVASPPEALAEARAYGKTAAKGDPNLEVTCPYPDGTDLYDAWLDGFEKAGGKVE